MANVFDQFDAEASGNVFDQFDSDPIDPSEDMNAGEAFAVGAGRGMVKSGRGIQTLWNMAQSVITGDESEDLNRLQSEREEEAALFEPLEERFPKSVFAGEIAGEIAATLPLGVGVGGLAQKGAASAATKFAPRAVGAASRYAPALAGGLTEGAIIGADQGSAGQGAAVGAATAGAAEFILPKIGKVLKRVYRGITDDQIAANVIVDASGNIKVSDDMQKALSDKGMTVDDITLEAMDELKKGSPEEAASLAMFRSEGIEPAGRSRISGDIKAQQAENFVLRQTDDAAATQFRQRVFDENQQLTQRFRDLSAELGVDPDVGESLKAAIQGQKSALASERREAYDVLGEIAANNPQMSVAFPVNKENILGGVREAAEWAIPQEKEAAVAKIFNEFGFGGKVKESPLDELIGRKPITDLNVGNLESLRQRINKVFDDSVPAERSARKSIIHSIDSELDIIADASDSALPEALASQAKKARALRSKEYEVFEAKDIVDQLIKEKPGTSTPMVDAAEVFGKIKRLKKEGEYNKLIGLLERGGNESKQALGNLQAAIVVDLLNESTKSTGTKLTSPTGERVTAFSGSQLEKAITNFGRAKLQRMFKSNPEAFRSLKRLEEIGKRRITGVEAVQKGSIPPAVLNNLWSSLSNTKGVGRFVPDPVKMQAKRQLKTALDLKPAKEEIDDFITFNAPRLAAELGIATPATKEATERDN